MATQFERFISTMKKVLMLDQADLDFGIYRIMNQKRNEIERYLNNDLKSQVADAIRINASGTSVSLEQQLQTAIDQANALGINPDSLPKVKQLKQQIAESGNSEDLENEVYSHLTTFFSRYYDGGDFISQRRYKKDVYAIPYEGEEVKLHWANADQYYIKTSEYFRNYRFELRDGRFCEFTLKEASIEQNNNLAQNNMERRFAIFEECPIEMIDNTIHINFTYELMPKATKQKQLIDVAFEKVKDMIPNEYKLDLLAARPTESDRNRTLLQKHLTDYVARNTFDYFIHKDLNGFLTRELDFYIKNEILEIDDINARSTDEFVKHLTVIKAIKSVGTKLITFLASLEDYQKRLWLKKKFVVQCDYCITLDRVPESLYAEICANDTQREEWVRLFAIDEIKGFMGNDGYSEPLTVEFLKNNPFLVLDTQFFSSEFKQELLSSIDNIDEQCDGLLINSDNFQALELLQEKYNKQVNCIYIDPPYNTGPSKIIYKNSFQNGCWLSLMDNRLNLGYQLLDSASCVCVAIDDFEMANLAKLLDANTLGYKRDMIVVNHHPQGTPKENVSRTHEYAIILSPQGENVMKNEGELEEEELRPLMRSGSADNNYRHGRWKSFYAILINPDTKEVKGFEEPPALGLTYPTGLTSEGWQRVYPISKNGDERVWRISSDSKKLKTRKIWELVKSSKTGTLYQIISNKKEPINSNWTDKRYNAGTFGTTVIANLFGKSSVFSYPKSIYTVQDYIKSVTESDNCDIIMDFFAGSGTTAHAVINLNRDDDGGNRKYILCEMGDYFNTATKPRIEKAVYSKDWNAGKPVSREGISHCFKYMRLEQYEDTLNNLVLKSSNIDATNADFYGGYMMGYLLNTETRDSLFNLQWFRNPWNMKLKITRQNEQKEENVDMIETFNYLIGLNVKNINYPKTDICTVEGTTRNGEKTLVIWRNCDKVDNKELNDFFLKMDYSTRDSEFNRIYVNGDNNLENLRTEKEQWKVILIEEEFSKRMFEDC